MHVVIANPFDRLPWESKRRGRYGQLSAELGRRGHRVTWLTADFHHATKRYREYRYAVSGPQGVQIVLLHVPPYPGNICIQRLVSHWCYARAVSRALRELNTSCRVDLVLASIPPIGSARAAMDFASEVGIFGVVDIQDAWPKVLELAFSQPLRVLARTALLAASRRDAASAVDLAQALVAVSPEYLAYAKSLRSARVGLPEAVFPLGFDAAQVYPPPQACPASSGSLTAAYIGNFGRFYDLDTVIRAAGICAPRGIRVTLIGDGPTYGHVKELAAKLGIGNVDFRGRMRFENAVPLLMSSHVGLIPITADWPPNTPNKAFDYMFMGLPIISSIGGSFRATLQSAGFGLSYDPGDAESLARALGLLDSHRHMLQDMGERALMYAQAHWDGQVIYSQYADFLESVANRP